MVYLMNTDVSVIPAEAGIQKKLVNKNWIPAPAFAWGRLCAGMTTNMPPNEIVL